MKNDKKRFVVACGGTGGHVFPGIAVAQVLRNRGHEVEVWLSGRAIEKSSSLGWDGAVFSSGVRQLSPKNVPNLIASFFRCRSRLKKFRPHALLAMGSYSSLPPVLTARLSSVPVVLHEANAVPGKAVEMLSRFADTVAVSFPETARRLAGRSTTLTGLPVRDELIMDTPYEDLPAKKFTLFVTGGSQGAHRVNELVAQAFALLEKEHPGQITLLHQCGTEDEPWLKNHYALHNVDARVAAFFPDIGKAYASADMVIARAGASTCFELAMLAKPALLIPLPSAVRNHQHENAQALVLAGGADEAIQSEMTGRSLMRYLLGKMKDTAALHRMSQAMKSFSTPDAAERVARILEHQCLKEGE